MGVGVSVMVGVGVMVGVSDGSLVGVGLRKGVTVGMGVKVRKLLAGAGGVPGARVEVQANIRMSSPKIISAYVERRFIDSQSSSGCAVARASSTPSIDLMTVSTRLKVSKLSTSIET